MIRMCMSDSWFSLVRHLENTLLAMVVVVRGWRRGGELDLSHRIFLIRGFLVVLPLIGSKICALTRGNLCTVCTFEKNSNCVLFTFDDLCAKCTFCVRFRVRKLCALYTFCVFGSAPMRESAKIQNCESMGRPASPTAERASQRIFLFSSVLR